MVHGVLVLQQISAGLIWSLFLPVVKVKQRRLSFFGHVCRLPEDTPVKIALKEAQRKTKKRRGRPKTTYLKQIENNLKTLIEPIDCMEDATEIAQNRQKWHSRTQD